MMVIPPTFCCTSSAHSGVESTLAMLERGPRARRRTLLPSADWRKFLRAACIVGASSSAVVAACRVVSRSVKRCSSAHEINVARADVNHSKFGTCGASRPGTTGIVPQPTARNMPRTRNAPTLASSHAPETVVTKCKLPLLARAPRASKSSKPASVSHQIAPHEALRSIVLRQPLPATGPSPHSTSAARGGGKLYTAESMSRHA
mmetsp:Transcript_3750/g.6152  ORF Transcript_3750/g.6152 Transcript_3750/m.6152 type:complete len:204 (+) Transcript_3750:92-703(+)